MENQILQVKHLSKNFGAKKALRDVSFTSQRGHIVGLVGPNGAGKSTIMKAILGLFNYRNGQIKVDNTIVSPESHRSMSKVGALIEYPGLYPFLTGYQHLQLFANKNIKKAQIMDIVNEMRMGKYINRRAKGYSLGMKQKLGIALALLNHPELVILDEPMNGLDPQANKDLRTIILALARRGTTFLISSHILSELEKLVDDLVVIDKGQVVYTGSMIKLQKASQKLLVLKTSNDAKARDLLRQNGYVLSKSPQVAIVEKRDTQMPEIIKLLAETEIEIDDVQHISDNLETSLLGMLQHDKVKEL